MNFDVVADLMETMAILVLWWFVLLLLLCVLFFPPYAFRSFHSGQGIVKCWRYYFTGSMITMTTTTTTTTTDDKRVANKYVYNDNDRSMVKQDTISIYITRCRGNFEVQISNKRWMVAFFWFIARFLALISYSFVFIVLWFVCVFSFSLLCLVPS